MTTPEIFPESRPFFSQSEKGLPLLSRNSISIHSSDNAARQSGNLKRNSHFKALHIRALKLAIFSEGSAELWAVSRHKAPRAKNLVSTRFFTLYIAENMLSKQSARTSVILQRPHRFLHRHASFYMNRTRSATAPVSPDSHCSNSLRSTSGLVIIRTAQRIKPQTRPPIWAA